MPIGNLEEPTVQTNLRFSICDKSGLPQGKVLMQLDWRRQQWSVKPGQKAWERVGFSQQGAFELTSWGVIWIWDRNGGEKKNTMILWHAPLHDRDTLHTSARGRLYDPKESALKDCLFDWETAAPTAAKA
jgi:hypothetical protein